MYRDSNNLVSAGIGFLINNAPEDALAIRAMGANSHGWIRKSTGLPASEQEVRAEWAMVKRKGGRADAVTMGPLTTIELPRPVIDNHVFELAWRNINWLKINGHNWDYYPADGQLGLLSLAWNGLGKYPKCLDYVKSGNWFYASGEATFRGIPRRQAETQRLFCNAGRTVARGLDPDVLRFDQWKRGRAFIFKGSEYASCEIHPDGEELERDRPQPVLIDSEANPGTDWPGFRQRGFHSGIQAALNYGNGKLYFFKGNQYIRYDLASYATDGPFLIDSGQLRDTDWHGLRAVGFDANISAALNWGDGRVFFFKDDSFVTYGVASNCVIDVRRPIDSESDPLHDWAGMKKTGFGSGIRAALNWGDGRVFFFKGNQYVKFLIHPGRVDDGYPLTIDSGWGNTLKIAGFTSNLEAAVDID